MMRETTLQLAAVAVVMAAVFSYAAGHASRAAAVAADALDRPSGGRKIHHEPVPLWGGLGLGLTVIAILFAYHAYGTVFGPAIRPGQVLGFAAGIVILLIGGLIDDLRPLPPRVQILFPTLAAVAVIIGGTGIVQVTDPTSSRALSLVWWKLRWGSVALSLPSDLITFAWLLVATYATKVLDGLDGLVTGLTAIGAGIVASLSLSTAYFQPGVAVLSAAVGGAFAGFLPRNAYPAKQFLGEAGSTIAGFSLGVLAILSSAKVAVALAVLAIPITDVALVVLGRVRRGVPPFKGDDTHLHFRLLQAGLSQRLAVSLYWAIALAAGVLALGLQTRGKLFLVAFLVVLTALTSFGAGWVARRRPL